MGIDYFRSGELIEITVRDYGKKKIESHTCNGKDSKKYGAIIKYLNDKYGFKPTIDLDKSINNENQEPNQDEIDWWA